MVESNTLLDNSNVNGSGNFVNTNVSDDDLEKYKKKTKSFSPPLIAKEINDEIDKEIHFLKMDGNNKIWRYDRKTGLYRDDGEDVIKASVQVILGNHFTSHIAYEVANWFKVRMAEGYVITECDFDSNINLINLENGVFDLETMKLLPFNHEYRQTIKLPITYNPDSKFNGSKVESFLKDILNEDDIPVIQELCGYFLIKEYPFNKAFMFHGDGCNGKSTLINLFRRFLGKENITSVSLQDLLYNRFTKIRLHGKMGNMSSDISSKPLGYTDAFKMLTGEDSISGEKKHMDSIEFDNYAKLIFACNQLPDTKDNSYAFFRRWIIIDFPNQFEGDKCNPNILDEITTEEEISTLFNWGLEGLKRLRDNKGFSHSKSTEEIKKTYIRMSSPIKAFIDEYIVETLEGEVIKADVYDTYKDYCNENDVIPKASNQFSIEIKRYIRKIQDGTLHRGIKVWRGISLKDN